MEFLTNSSSSAVNFLEIILRFINNFDIKKNKILALLQFISFKIQS